MGLYLVQEIDSICKSGAFDALTVQRKLNDISSEVPIECRLRSCSCHCNPCIDLIHKSAQTLPMPLVSLKSKMGSKHLRNAFSACNQCSQLMLVQNKIQHPKELIGKHLNGLGCCLGYHYKQSQHSCSDTWHGYNNSVLKLA